MVETREAMEIFVGAKDIGALACRKLRETGRKVYLSAPTAVEEVFFSSRPGVDGINERSALHFIGQIKMSI